MFNRVCDNIIAKIESASSSIGGVSIRGNNKRGRVSDIMKAILYIDGKETTYIYIHIPGISGTLYTCSALTSKLVIVSTTWSPSVVAQCESHTRAISPGIPEK